MKFQSIQIVPEDLPHMQLLHESLRERTRRIILRALRAFRLISDRSVVSLAIEGLQSLDDDQRANALELLAALDEKHLVEPALELWESDRLAPAPSESHVLVVRRAAVILELFQYDDEWLRACAALAAKDVHLPEIRNRLMSLAETDPDPVVRETAAAQLITEEMMTTISTLPIMERILFLRKVPLFSKLSPEELMQVASIAGEHIFKDGEIFVREGEVGDEMFVIVSGNVRVTKGSDESEIAQRGPGEFVGEMSILAHEPRMASLVADGDVFALCLEQDNFEQMLLEKPEIGLSVIRALIQRLKTSRA